MSTTSTSVMEIYRKIGQSLELFFTAKTERERKMWADETNVLLGALAAHTGTVLTIEQFTQEWFKSEFEGRLRPDS